ncbi:MAG: hypothetical protein Q9N68_12640 [Gammaproteobacteria bacterium]|nr:hypothetical protein [Gammaproteobacteria bacterium]
MYKLITLLCLLSQALFFSTLSWAENTANLLVNTPLYVFLPLKNRAPANRLLARKKIRFSSEEGNKLRLLFKKANGFAFFSAGLPENNSHRPEEAFKNLDRLSAAIGYAFQTQRNYQVAFMFGTDRLTHSHIGSWDADDQNWLSVTLGIDLFH